MDHIEEWTPPPLPAIERPRPPYRRAEMMFHLLLPAAAFLIGLLLLLGWIHYVNNGDGTIDAKLTFVVGTVLTVLGGLELEIWRRRLRRLNAPAANAAECDRRGGG
jgi:hypothetical protein